MASLFCGIEMPAEDIPMIISLFKVKLQWKLAKKNVKKDEKNDYDDIII